MRARTLTFIEAWMDTHIRDEPTLETCLFAQTQQLTKHCIRDALAEGISVSQLKAVVGDPIVLVGALLSNVLENEQYRLRRAG